MMEQFKYVVSVDIGNELCVCVMDDRIVDPGDLVNVAPGILGEATRVAMFDTDGEDYKMLMDFAPQRDVLDVYSHVWSAKKHDGQEA